MSSKLNTWRSIVGLCVCIYVRVYLATGVVIARRGRRQDSRNPSSIRRITAE